MGGKAWRQECGQPGSQEAGTEDRKLGRAIKPQSPDSKLPPAKAPHPKGSITSPQSVPPNRDQAFRYMSL